MAAGEKRGAGKSGHGGDGEFDSSKITMKRWGDFEQERRLKQPTWGGSGGYSQSPTAYGSEGRTYSHSSPTTGYGSEGRTHRKHERAPSNLVFKESYSGYR